MKKRFLMILATILLSTSLTMTVFAAEWKNDGNGWWLAEDNGSYPASQWKMVNGSWYYFDQDGYMKTGWQQDGNDWYYLDGDGRMAAGEARTIDGVLYTFAADGKMLSEGGQEAQAPEVTKEQMEQWFYSTYAIIANASTWNSDYFKSTPGTWENEARHRLNMAWGISDKSSADSSVRRLKQRGDLGGGAWDYCRAMQVIRECYLAGYYTETEELDKMLEVAKAIQGGFSSWDDMAENYITGSYSWSGSISDYNSRKEIHERLKRSSNCYQTDWNIALQKCWN